METKKVIEQEVENDLIIWFFDHVIKVRNLGTDPAYIEKSKATEVAKAIDPKYQELEKEIQELRVKHQMFIGSVSEKLGFEDTATILGEVTQALKK